MPYVRTGRSGLRLPRISLGLWNNFGSNKGWETQRDLVTHAFDRGVTHFDLANNYGPPPGAAETAFGQIIGGDLAAYRDEIIVSSKAGYLMWDGPYGEWGSRKSMLASLDQSLQRTGLDYFDIFYSHRPDPETPIEEQFEDDLLPTLAELGVGSIVFSPLAGGLLTERYLDGVPADSRAAEGRWMNSSDIDEEYLATARALVEIAHARGQNLSQLALSWVLRRPEVTSALIGASSVAQLDENLATLENVDISARGVGRDRAARTPALTLESDGTQHGIALSRELL